MKILVDADACPVVDQTLRCAKAHRTEVWLICDTAHQMEREGAHTLTVAKGSDSADFTLVNRIEPGDVVVTQDYGLAAMALAREARPLNQNGMRYTQDNIDALLLARHTARKIRQGGGRLKGPPKRTHQQNEDFTLALQALLNEPTAGDTGRQAEGR